MVKNLLTNEGDARDVGSIPGLGQSLGVGSGNCLESSMDRDPGGLQSTGP